jgi:hypothetical protein
MTVPVKSIALTCLVLAAVAFVPPRLARPGEPEPDAPGPVAEGSVGERGPSTVLVHRVSSGPRRLMVLRTTRSSLCGNTGAVALLVVNGEPRVHRVLTEVGSSVEIEAGPRDRVVAIVHTIPLFNEIVCARLGRLDVVLEARDP